MKKTIITICLLAIGTGALAAGTIDKLNRLDQKINTSLNKPAQEKAKYDKKRLDPKKELEAKQEAQRKAIADKQEDRKKQQQTQQKRIQQKKDAINELKKW